MMGYRIRSSPPPTVRECLYMLKDLSPILEQECDHETGSRDSAGRGTDDGPELVEELYVWSLVLSVSQTSGSK